MAELTAGPFRWWHQDGWRQPVVSSLLYRQEAWVSTFLAHVDTELSRTRPRSVTLDTRRDALVVTGAESPGTLRTARATYRDVLLFHPHLHPDVADRVDEAVTVAATECARRNFYQGEEIRQGGRAYLRSTPGALLHPAVVDGLRRLDLSGLPPMGVSGVVEVRADDDCYVVASLRSTKVAVSPSCLGPTVDGGLVRTGTTIDPQAALRNEIKLELPGIVAEDDMEWLGTLLPPGRPTAVGGDATRRCGVNVVYRGVIDRDPVDVLRGAPDHFEARELVLVRSSGTRPSDRPPILALRDGQLVPFTDVVPMSEVLAAALADRRVVKVAVRQGSRERRPPRQPKSTEARAMSKTSSISATLSTDLTLEDAWAEDLIKRHPRLNRMLNRERLAELAEPGTAPTLEMLLPVFDAVREFEFVRNAAQVKAADDARLFEAIVYRVGRYLFANDEDRALAAHDVLLPRDKTDLPEGEDPNPIGTTYTQRLKDVLKEDQDVDPESVWRDEVGAALEGLNREEAVQEYAEVARRGRVLCFCAALWALEIKRGPAAAMVALEDAYRKSLAGDEVSLFFRARSLLASPVISAAQAQLGLQFVTTALAKYPNNPGMHHTRALYLLRQSSLSEIEQVTLACLGQALDSVETALLWDAEFALFYATRAKVKYRLKDRFGALIDIRAAIELARYSEASPVVQREVESWVTMLDTWQLAPVGTPVE